MTEIIKNILVKGDFSVNGSLWIENGEKRFLGPGPVELLEYIDETGSINQAAKKMDMSYKKAWEIISNLNTAATNPLVAYQSGRDCI